MKTILDLSNIKAYRYFMEPENYCTVSFPVYISFKKILEYVESTVGNNELKTILKDSKKMPSAFENVNHTILIKKDGMYAYRPIQIANPYLYYLLVKILTNKANWAALKKRFEEFKVPQIEVASIPKVKSEKGKTHQAASVTFWWENVEQRSIELALKYRYMFVTDITNCYASMYTHTIAWAVMDKEKAKEKIKVKGLLGNIIDRYIQGMQFGQTNGIPQGSVLFDFIAEMILGYADNQLADKLAANGIEEYTILRYRDDYRIFSNSKDELEKIAFFLQEVLTELNLQLNTKKTILTEDVVTDSIKKDKVWYVTNIPLFRKRQKKIHSLGSCLQQEALYIHQFAKKYPNSGTVVKLLMLFARRLKNRTVSKDEVLVLISMFADIAMDSPKGYKIVLMIISKLLREFPTTAERKEIVNDLYGKFERMPNIGELQIWLQRITYKMPDPIDYTEPICHIVAGIADVKLWNLEWVADEYKEDFPLSSICTDWIRDSFTPIIDIDEISLFDY